MAQTKNHWQIMQSIRFFVLGVGDIQFAVVLQQEIPPNETLSLSGLWIMLDIHVIVFGKRCSC